MSEPPTRGFRLRRDPGKPGGKKPFSFSELGRKVPDFFKTGWRRTMLEKRWPLALAIAVFVALFVAPYMSIGTHKYRVGDYTVKAIKAPRDMTIVDNVSTLARQEEAATKVWSIYDFDSAQKEELQKRIDTAFDNAREFFDFSKPKQSGNSVAMAKIIPKSEADAALGEFIKTLGISLSDKELALLQRSGFSKSIQELAKIYVGIALKNKIVGNKKFLLDDISSGQTGVTIRHVDSKKEESLTKFDDVYDLDQVKKLLQSEAGQKENTASNRLALKIANKLIQPNLTFNKNETEERKNKERERVVPSVMEFKKNQRIAGEGERVTEEIKAILDSMYESQSRGDVVLAFIGIVALNFMSLLIIFTFGERNISKFKITGRDMLFLGSVICVGTFLIWIGMVIIDAISDQFEFLPTQILILAIPIVAGAMTVRFILNSEIAVLFALLFSMIASLIVEPSLTMFVFFFVGSLVGAHFIAHASQRNTILLAGIWAGLLNMAVILTLTLGINPQADLFSWSMLLRLVFAFVGGALAGPVVLAVTPVIEWLFGYTSNIKLLELASLNHPLLKEMVVQAPGTYNHSTLVSSLAEGAAEAVGCNPLLAKVAAIYHDIGKLNKPEYFYENLGGQENKHDGLYPSMSGLILTSHVKEGVDLALRHNLGDDITNIIRQHHGTSLIYYFYRLAKEREDPDKSPVEEKDFRYPGPKPQTREAAIVMLADVIEASSRSLPKPTPARIQQNVEEMIEHAFADGQLDECDLTLKDLQKIANSFVITLNGIFHSRIQYPEREGKENPSLGNDPDTKPPKDTKGTGSAPEKSRAKDF